MSSKRKNEEVEEIDGDINNDFDDAELNGLQSTLEDLSDPEPKDVTIEEHEVKLNLNEVIEDLIKKSIKETINNITDEKLQDLMFPLIQKEFTEKIAPAIKSNIKDIVKETLSEIFNKNI